MTLWYGLLIWSDYDDLWSVSFYDILLTYSVWPILVWHPSQIYFTRHGGSMSVSGMHPWHDSRAVEWCSATSPYLLSVMSSIVCLLWPILLMWGRMDASYICFWFLFSVICYLYLVIDVACMHVLHNSGRCNTPTRQGSKCHIMVSIRT